MDKKQWILIGIIGFLALAALGFTIAAVVCESKCKKESYTAKDDDYTGKCQCEWQYRGDACQYTCPGLDTKNKYVCSNHGTCQDDGTCKCSAGWKGDDCNTPDQDCPNNCSGHGTCDRTKGTCTCNKGWTGDDCNTPDQDCPNNCTDADHGVCDRTKGTCTCKNHWSGDDCSTCPPNWDPAQSCNKCLAHWTGAKCDTCANHWSGDDCNTCPKYWDSSADCNACLTGYGPPDKCDTAKCPGWKDWTSPQCSGHGKCIISS